MGSAHRRGDVPDANLAMPELPVPNAVGAQAGFIPPSFESVYRAHGKTVARWAIRLLGPPGDFEDAVQDVFMVVRRRLPEFRGDAEITTWLYEITVRVAQRSRQRARWWSWATGRGQSPGRGRELETFVPAAEMPNDPQAILEARERTRLLYQILDELGQAERTAFILFEMEGLSGEQIATITGASINAVWVRLSRARRKFLDRMHAWEAEE
jgi:RNA polymerase sigma-70 factor (ECF subfamily)